MEISFKGLNYQFPSSLQDITLGQRIGFYIEHGKSLDDRAKVIEALTDEFDKELERTSWHLDYAARMLSFYTGIELDTVKTEMPIVDLVHIYNTCVSVLNEQEQSVELQTAYSWQDNEWILSVPELLPNSDMNLNEFIYAKEAVRNLDSLGKSKWESLPYLCSIYLRKAGEPFSESLVAAGSERMELMNNLPLNIAIAVGFFLTGIMNIYTNISAYSENPAAKDSIQLPTSTNGDGSLS